MALTQDVNKRINRLVTPYLGSDPELFVATKGKIIGAEKVIPQEGVISNPNSGRKQIVLDGVQLELHPAPSHCRALIANDFKQIFIKLAKTLKDKGAEASFTPVVKLTPEEMKTLSAAARQLGCAPSKNVQNPTATIKVPKTFRERSAGGHLHVSFLAPGQYMAPHYATLLQPAWVEKFVKTFDCMVGLPSVLIDRDPAQKQRRKYYGRASEHRTPPYGIEYRVLSNYWLRSYQLMSFVHGMVRQAVNVVLTDNRQFSTLSWAATDELFSRVDMDKVWDAINTNNFDKALKQWDGVASFIDEFCADAQSGLASGMTENFRFFAHQVKEKGLSYWFPDDPMTHWCNIPEGHQFNAEGFAGWETFITSFVSQSKADIEVDDIISRLKKVA